MTATPLDAPLDRPRVNPWVTAFAVLVPTFMLVLDTTIVNVALPQMAGTLSASNDEATWALTSYLIANAVILPMTGWLANFFGRKRLLLFSVIGFTVSSLLCGVAPSMPLMVLFRIMQGFSGGGMQPISQAILLESFAPKDRGKAMAIWGIGIVVAPMIGPILGGWLTDSYSWRWIFYINIPFGVLSFFLVQAFVFDPPYIKRGRGGIDFWGLGLLVVGVGALQLVLDKGQQEDWFSSAWITSFAIISVVALVALVIRELKTEHPIVDLRVFKDRTFTTGSLLVGVMGFGLYGGTVLLTLVMQTLFRYSAFDTGLFTMPRGMASFLVMPLVGVLMVRVDPRKLLVFSLILVSISLALFSRLTLDSGFPQLIVGLVVQGVGLGMLFVPLSTASHAHLPQEKIGNGTSLYNLMRNIGGSVGIATATTLLARRSQVHINELGANVTAFSSATSQQLAAIRQGLIGRGVDSYTAGRQAVGLVFGKVQRHAAMMSYDDAFIVLWVVLTVTIPLVALMRRARHEIHKVADSGR